ncbi:MAG TPA: DinB family protein [Actinocatenispora sp.]
MEATRGDQRPPVIESDEKATLVAFLGYVREAVIAKAAGLPAELAGASGVPSGTSVLGLVRHLAAAETHWFTWAYAGENIPFPDLGMALGPDETAASVIADYRAAIARSDAVIAACDDLSARSARAASRPPRIRTMRWILVHMIEETARHAGHADILREQADGSTGR